jgi:hypothetical protein
MIATFKTLNLAVRFGLELALLAALAMYCWRVLPSGPVRITRTIGMPLVAMVIWATVVHGSGIPVFGEDRNTDLPLRPRRCRRSRIASTPRARRQLRGNGSRQRSADGCLGPVGGLAGKRDTRCGAPMPGQQTTPV